MAAPTPPPQPPPREVSPEAQGPIDPSMARSALGTLPPSPEMPTPFSNVGPGQALSPGDIARATPNSEEIVTGIGRAAKRAADAVGNALSAGSQAERVSSGLEEPSATVSSSTPETASTPKPEPPLIKADTTPTKERYVVKGATGTPKSATAAPEAPPNATPKASIDPTFLVQLEKSNPALHDQIVQAATAAGVGSWDYANLLYATSKLDPNYNEGGRKGMAGLTDADIASFKNSAYGQAFANADPMNPATNLMMGALKFRETRDDFGPRTPSSILAYRVGTDRTNELSRHTPEQQREHLPPVDMNFVQQAIGGPNAKPGTESQDKLTDNGTYQPRAGAQAMVASAQAGDPRIYYRYQNDNLPRGMTSNDGWRYAEGKMVTGFIRAGDMEGAQKAREMLFQMQHVGANQALMRAHSLLGAGDMVGAAKELALAYWATPDGGQARVHVTPQGIIAQRYNEATGQPVGAPIPMDQARIMSLMQLTQDPMAYQKNVREGAKLNAEIADKAADVEYKKAQAGYLKQRPDIEMAKSENVLEGRIAEIQRKIAAAGAADPKAMEELRRHLDRLEPQYWPEKDMVGMPAEISARQGRETDVWRDLNFNNRSITPSRSAQIAKGLSTGEYGARPYTGSNKALAGSGMVTDKAGTPLGIVLSPTAMRVLAPSRPAAAPASPIGATPAPPR